MNNPLMLDEKQYLLKLARESIEDTVNDVDLRMIDLTTVPLNLLENAASFVTLTIDGNLRGCIGSLEAYQPLVLDVQQHAVQAAVEDYRFPPLSEEELPLVEIEISVLTTPIPLNYEKLDQLLRAIRPGIDGIILQDGIRRATFLPQVWEQLPDPAMFLSHLCSKMGAPASLWERKKLQVSTYQVEEFCEAKD